MKLKKNIGRLEVKALGLVLTQDSTEEEIKRAIKHQPSIKDSLEGASTSKAKD